MAVSARSRPKIGAWQVLCAVLVIALAFTSWRAYAIDAERDALRGEFQQERKGRILADRWAKDLEMRFANFVLENQVDADIVRKRVAQQEQRASELEEMEEGVREQKLAEADCVTPRSVLEAAGL